MRTMKKTFSIFFILLFGNFSLWAQTPCTLQKKCSLDGAKRNQGALFPDCTSFHPGYISKTQRLYVATLATGSLRYNIIRVAREYGWNTVVWNAPEDYLWVGQTHIAASNLQNIMQQILCKYPLQAQFYYGNHVLAVVPRNLS